MAAFHNESTAWPSIARAVGRNCNGRPIRGRLDAGEAPSGDEALDLIVGLRVWRATP
jgi:hypothetical protein